MMSESDGVAGRQGGAAGESEFTYFSIQSMWGATKHFGGLASTDRLAEACGIGPNAMVLEVGCGVGTTSCHLVQRYGCTLVSVEISDRMLEWARRRALRRGLADRVVFQVADVQDLPFEDGRFDAVITESVAAFVPDKARALGECVRVAKSGGAVGLCEGTWVRTPPPVDLAAALTRMMDGAQFLPADGWRALLQGSGLVDLRADAFRMRLVRQRLDEMQGLDARDYLDRLRAWRTFVALAVRSPSFRRYARGLIPSVAVARGMFSYLGYGIYVGRKP